MVARSINSPEFSFGSPDQKMGSIKIKREIRAGFLYYFQPDWFITMDLDLTNNETGISSYKERLLAIGTEKVLSNGKYLIRGGLQKNLSESEAPAFTFGGGLKYSRIGIDAGFGFDTSFERIIGSVTMSIQFPR
ncbi:MAG: hypothetical protein A2161_01595 [Candidatus Schekmanbacteria bacterium RBG_13_48_7]|uniref:Uncharacterized protein n=1 Tax=Candidatus Schekmanbacteria bacterium RBG_13_48_7 TaxID=1817878 RepID=A0A1F7RP24_9BACT|nr:MAG: hypothetical protein A2161_01595 [Candidatus Schekmanbacteria bacterium RBG_13_48_7]